MFNIASFLIVFLLGSGNLCFGVETKPAVVAPAAREFTTKSQKDFALRSLGRLRVLNRRGKIDIRAWSQDRIRVFIKKKALAVYKDDAEELFKASDLSFREQRGNVELLAEYGRGISMAEKIKERKSPQTWMDLIIYAPQNMEIEVWAMDEPVRVEGFRSDLFVRGRKAKIKILKQHKGSTRVTCPECDVTISESNCNIHIVGGSGDVSLLRVSARKIFVESTTGVIRANRVKGRQFYSSQAGVISGVALVGHVEFWSAAGDVNFDDVEGLVRGRSDSGDVTANIIRWVPDDEIFLETVSGNIHLILPSDFSAQVDIYSKRGSAKLEFPLRLLRSQKTAENAKNGKDAKNSKNANKASSPRLKGLVGESIGTDFRIHSVKGDIHIERGV